MWTVDALDGDHSAAALLSQLLWWFQPAKGTRQTRVRYEREGHLWLIRSDDDWYDDCRLSTKQVRRIRKALIERGLIVHRRFQVNGAPTGAWRPDFEALERYLADYEAECPDGQFTDPSSAQMGESIRPVGQVPIDPHLSHTPKTTTENQTLPAAKATDEAFEEFWQAYPKAMRKAKPDARAAFRDAIKKESPTTLLEAVRRYDADPNRLDEYTPYPQKWLKQERWNDPPEVRRRQASGQAPGAIDRAAERAKQRQAAGLPNFFDPKSPAPAIAAGE